MADENNLKALQPFCSKELNTFASCEPKQPLCCAQTNGLKNNDEFCHQFNNLECFVIKKNEESIPNIFVPTDLYVGSFKLQGNIENVIELINVDPNQSETIQETDVDEIKRNRNCAVLNLNGSNKSFFSFVSDVPFKKHDSEALNEDLINQEIVSGAECQNIVKNGKLESLINTEENIKVARAEEQEDVVFVCEYNLKAAEEAKKKESKQVAKSRGRKCNVVKRKNPVRKAQIEKKSQDLIEKLSYHPSVFNAKVKKKKLPQPVVEQKALRQSCRTTGAIYYPPEELTEKNYKIWPQTAHEVPFYNETKQVLELVPQYQHRPTASCPKENNLSEKPHINSIKENKNNFADVMSKSLNNVLNFSETFKQFNKLTASNDLVLSRSGELDSNQVENIPDDGKSSCQENLQNDMLYDLIENTCILYSIAANRDDEQIADLFRSRSIDGK